MKPKVNKPGKVLAQVAGLKIRLTPDKQFGIYAGKNLFQSFLLFESAHKVAKRIVSNKPSYYSLCQAFEKWKNSR